MHLELSLSTLGTRVLVIQGWPKLGMDCGIKTLLSVSVSPCLSFSPLFMKEEINLKEKIGFLPVCPGLLEVERSHTAEAETLSKWTVAEHHPTVLTKEQLTDSQMSFL